MGWRSRAPLVPIVLACAQCDASIGSSERAALRGWIYFISERDGEPRAYRIRPDGTGESPVFGRESYVYGANPDASRIAAVAARAEAHEIVLAAPDGGSESVLAASGGLAWHPRFSPDGKRVLFESSRESFRDLYVAEIGGGVSRLTNDPEGNFDGVWSPDGQRIAFVSSRHGQLDLFVMRADGSAQDRLTSHPGDVVRPAWAGERIAFISGRDEKDGLFSISEKSGLEKLSPGGGEVEDFAVHPSARMIAYTFRVSGRGTIRIHDLARGIDLELIQGGDDADPAWSPDGRHIVFARKKRERVDLWIARADGSGAVRLTHDASAAWLPRWLDVQRGNER